MIEVTHHQTPRWRNVVLEQIRIVALSLRRETMAAAVVAGIVTLIISIDIAHGHARTWFDSDEWTSVCWLAFLFPFAVWRTEKRFGPAFLWTLPVDRRRLALTKVFAGWVWMIAVGGSFVLWHKTLAIISGVPAPRTTPLVSLTGATAMYLLGSALVLGLRHPLRLLLGTAGVFFLLGTLNETIGRTGATSRMLAWMGIDTLRTSHFSSAADHAAAIWLTYPHLAWTVTVILWIGSGLIAVWAAASRHRERRRQ
jgi:hypothetical protein